MQRQDGPECESIPKNGTNFYFVGDTVLNNYASLTLEVFSVVYTVLLEQVFHATVTGLFSAPQSFQ